MDRACASRAAGTRGRGGGLRSFGLAVVLCVACSTITGSDRVVAIDFLGSTEPTVEEGDTLRLTARAIDAGGNVVEDAPIVWDLLDLDSGQVGFTLDSLSGLVTAMSPGSGRVRPRIDDLRFNPPATVTVTGAPDSVAAAGSERLSVLAADVTSPNLVVTLYDLTTEPDSTLLVADKPVRFQLTDPLPTSGLADGFFLTQTDTLAGETPHDLTVTTDANGQGFAVVRKVAGGSLPDSAVVAATVTTAAGVVVPTSPIRFVVVFEK